jgi:hypothetical protein
MASQWRWSSNCEFLVLEPVLDGSMLSLGGDDVGLLVVDGVGAALRGDVADVLLLLGCRDFCGCCGCWPAGSGSFFAWRRCSLASCLDPRVGNVGARPRSMGDRRRLHLVSCDGCLL